MLATDGMYEENYSGAVDRLGPSGWQDAVLQAQPTRLRTRYSVSTWAPQCLCAEG